MNNSLSTSCVSPGVEKWKKLFKTDPVEALDRALLQTMNLGNFESDSSYYMSTNAISQMVEIEELEILDQSLKTWLENQLDINFKEVDVEDMLISNIKLKRYTQGLVNSYYLINRLKLNKCLEFCRNNQTQITKWIQESNFPNSSFVESKFVDIINRNI